MIDSPQENVAAKRDVPKPNNILDDSRPKFVNVVDVSSPNANDEFSKEIIFKYEGTTIRAIVVPSSFSIFQKPSSSKARFHLGLSSSS